MGGRRRSAVNKPVPKRRPKLDKIFKCPVCSHDGSIVTMTQKDKGMEAVISCKVCKESHKYSKRVSFLTEPIDVYSDWLDFLEAKKKRNSAKRTPSSGAGQSPARMRKSASKQLDDADDDDDGDEEDIMNVPSVKKAKKTEEEPDEDEDVDEEDDDEDEDDADDNE